MGLSCSCRALLAWLPVLVGGCAAPADAPPELTWRPRFEAALGALDADLLALDRDVAARPVEAQDPAAVAAYVAALAARDRRVHAAWARILGEVPPYERGVARRRLARRVLAVQEDNAARLAPLLDRHGWLTISDFGAAADRDAWRVVQHADHDLALQARVLVVLEGLAEVGETDPAHYAYLADRVAVARGEPQPFGTQGSCTGTGAWEPAPLLEPETVDDRRAAMGLPPLAEYAALAGADCP